MTLKEFVVENPDKNFSYIARGVPCTPQYISLIASGKKVPSYKIAKKIQKITSGKVKISNWYK